MKKLSKSIWLPDDPEDPAAFTQTPGFTRTSKKPWCSSKPVYKIVGTFALFMTLGLVVIILYSNCKYSVGTREIVFSLQASNVPTFE